MAKKLTLELDVRNERAKKAAKEVGEAAAAGMDRAAAASDRLAGSLDKAADGMKLSGKQLASVAASMGGMVLGTVAKAVALKTEEGSAAQQALGYGGAAMQGLGTGAAMGSMFGPLGTAVGALAGAAMALANKFLDDETQERQKQDQLRKTNQANREMVESLLSAQRRTEDFQRMIDSLGDREKSLAERQGEVQAEIEKREAAERRLKAVMRDRSSDAATEAEQKELSKALKEYQANGAELSRLRSLQKSMEKSAPAAEAYRAAFTATDAITRLGGAFAGGGSNIGRDQLKVASDQLAVLKSIDSKTRQGGATWQ